MTPNEIQPQRLLLRVIPTRRLAWAVAAVGLLWLLPGRVGVYAGLAGIAVVLLLAAVDWATLPGKRGVIIERDAPPAVGIGDRVRGTYTLRSAWARTLRVSVVDEMPGAVRGGIGSADVEL